MKRPRYTKKKMLLMLAVLFALVLSVSFVTVSALAAEAPTGEKLQSYQVTMSGNLNLKFIYSSLGNADAFKAEVYAPGENTPVNTYTYPVSRISESKTVSVPLAPSEMSYTVKVYPVKLSGSTVVSVGTEKSYSVVKYANAVITKTDEYDDMMRALLNWGGFARQFFDETESDLANEGVFTRGTNPQSTVTSVPVPDKDAVQMDGNVFSSGSLSLSLERNNISLRLYFKYSGSDKLSATVKRDGIDETSTVISVQDDGRYLIKIEKINVNLFDDVYTVNVKAGSSTLRAQVSVLEYLNAMVTGAGYTDAQRSTARSLYQFYQLATGNVPTDCDHGGIDPETNSDFYYIPAETAGMSYYKCSHCFEQLGHGSIGDEVEYYLPAETIKSATTSAAMTLSLKTDSDGTSYVRASGATSKNVYINLKTSLGESVTGRYAAIKFRVGSNGLSQTYLTLNAGSAKSFKVSEGGDGWHVAVIDFSTTSVGSLTLTPFGNKTPQSSDYVDIAYVSVFDTVNDVSGVVKESTYEWSTSSTAYCTRNTSSSLCTTSAFTTLDDGSYVTKCSTCGNTVDHGVNKEYALNYLPAMKLKSSGSAATSYDVDVLSEGGITFARYSNFKVNSDNWYAINPLSYGKESGQYLIMKVRIPENDLGSTKLSVFSNSETLADGYTANLLTAEGETSFLLTDDNKWHTIVVDLKARVKDPSKTWNDKDTYSLTHFSIRPFADKQISASSEDCIDIAYLATCNELSDIPNIIKDDLVYEWSDTATSYEYRNSSDNSLHLCTANPDKTEIYVSKNGDKSYKYICASCDNVLYTREVKASVGYFMDALDISSHLTDNKLYLGDSTLTVGTGVGVPFAQGSNRQMLWCRSQADTSPAERSNQTDFTFDIGNAKYLAIRVRSDIQGRPFSLSYSTLGSNSPTAVADENTDFTTYKFAIDGSLNELGKTYATKSCFGGITFKMSEEPAGEWITYIVDLSQVLGDHHKKAEGMNSYVVDSFFWTFGEDFANGHIDIDFVAFLENFQDLGTLTQDRTALKITAKDGSGIVVDSTSGMCTENHTEKVITIKNSDGSTTYTLGCEKCGTVRQDVKPLNVPESTNYITDLNKMGGYQFDISLEYDSVSGVIYNRFTNTTGTTAGHMNFTGGSGSGSATTETYAPGRYVVMKYRISGPEGSSLNWYVNSYSSGTVGTLRQSSFPEEWTIVVYDMSENSKWYTAESSKLYFQGTTANGAVTTDIAYIATVDTIDELEELIGHEASYRWCGTQSLGSIGEIRHLDSAYCTDADNDGKCDDCGGNAVIYGNGGDVNESGNKFELGEFPLTDREVDESGAVTKSAAELLAMLEGKTAVHGKAYRVTEPLVLSSDKSYYGNLCHIIAEGGIVIDGVDNVVLKELVIKGYVTIKNSTNVTLYNVDLDASGVAVDIDSTSSDIKIDSSVITADVTAISSQADNVTVYGSYISANNGLISGGNGLAVQNNKIVAKNVGISATGEYCIVKNNTVEMPKSGEGIRFGEGSVNGLIALNVVKDAQSSITVNGGFNCVVILNSAVSISGTNNKNLYVVENNLGGLITLSGNKYLLADANKFVSDGKDHTVFNKDNSEYNGDNLHDVNARVEYGANEELLPHTNKDLFVGMERLTSVRDERYATSYSFDAYIKAMSRNSAVVIVPPGAYESSRIQLQSEHSNTKIYAYGVYQEKAVSKNEDGTLKFTESNSTIGSLMGNIFNIDGGNSIHVHGLTIGYDFQSSGQAYVLEKFGGNMIRIIANAGYIEGFAAADKNHFSTGISVTHGDEMYPWTNSVSHEYVAFENGEYIDEDGTMLIKITNSAVYTEMRVGDILGCRLAGDNAQTVYLGGQDLLMKDTVVYGYSASLALVSGGRGSVNVRLERHHNTSRPATLIDEETYNKYKALEVKYGLNADGADAAVNGAQGLEVYIDAEGRYRGGLPRYGSVDATHITGAEEGVSATSCLFENMVDDASNQRSSSSRIAGYVINNDGTTTIYIKGSLSKTYYGIDASKGKTNGTPTSSPALAAGDTMFAYAMNGKTFIEAAVLSAGNVTADPTGCHITHIDENSDCICDVAECGVALHYDFVKNGTTTVAPDCLCDVCGIKVHTDYRTDYIYDGIAPDNVNQGIVYYSGNNKCNNSGCELKNKSLMPRLDENGEPVLVNGMMVNDADGAPIVTDMTTYGKIRLHTGDYYVLEYQMLATNGKTNQQYIITYSTPLRMAVVNTSDVDFSAIEGHDLTDNDFFMCEKVLCDNLTLNSAGFTFDNVLMQNYHSRGVLTKTINSTMKNCTFRNVASTGVLMSIETTWGESTVPKNITVQSCLFDNTGHSLNYYNNTTYAPIAIQGLGDLSGQLAGVSEYGLPCKNINIIGNKFINTNNDYCITMTAAQDVTIKDNIFEVRGKSLELDAGKAIYIKGCMNIEVSGNTYINNSGIQNLIDGDTYKNLGGDDVDGVINSNSCGLTHTWTKTDTTHSIAACEKCGTEAVTNAPHKYIAKLINGEHVYICTCGYVSSEIPEHDYTATVVNGKHAYVCECGAVSSEIPPCTLVERLEGGDHFYVCAECGVRSEESAHVDKYLAKYNRDGSVIYKLGCSCGFNERGSITVPADINFFTDLTLMNNYSVNTTQTKYLYDENTDTMYNNITSTSATHINLTGGTGAGYATTESYEPGKYLVIKYRVNSGSGTLRFRVGYEGEPDSTDKGGVTWTATTPCSATAHLNTWRVEVLDLSNIATWPKKTSPIYFMLYPGMAIDIDVAYAATADSFSEISDLVTDDTFYFYGTNWGGTPLALDGETGYCKDEGSHSYSEVLEGSEHYYYCINCGYRTEESVHDYDYTESVLITNPDGSKTHAYVCVCGAASDIVPPCTSFTEVIGTNGDHYYECTECGKRGDDAPHTYSNNVLLSNPDGSKYHAYVCACGAESDEIPPCTVFEEVIENGDHYYKCSECGKRGDDAPHTYSNNVLLSNPDGSKYHAYVCACGAESDEIPPCTVFEEVIENGDHYKKCSECGKRSEESAHADTYQIIQNSDGSVTYGYGCKCGYNLKGTVTVPENVNYFANLRTMGYDNNGGTLIKYLYDEESEILYNRLDSSTATHLNISGDNEGGNFTLDDVELGKYLVIKYRTYNNSTMELRLGSETHRLTTSYTEDEYIGVSAGANGSSEWVVAVVDITGIAMYGEDPVASSKLYMMFLASYADVAYVAVVDSFDEMRGFVTDEKFAYHGTSFTNTPSFKYLDGDICLTHTNNGEGVYSRAVEGGTEYYNKCDCGEEFGSYIVPDSIGFITSLNTMTSNNGNVQSYLYDENNNVTYSSILGGGAYTSVSLTGEDPDGMYTGGYLVIKYRGDIGAGSVGMRINGSELISNEQKFHVTNDWTVAVIDLSQINAEMADTPAHINIDITIWADSGSVFDLAYVAVVDDLQDMTGFVSEDECTYYGFGNLGETDEWMGPNIDAI